MPASAPHTRTPTSQPHTHPIPITVYGPAWPYIFPMHLLDAIPYGGGYIRLLHCRSKSSVPSPLFLWQTFPIILSLCMSLKKLQIWVELFFPHLIGRWLWRQVDRKIIMKIPMKIPVIFNSIQEILGIWTYVCKVHSNTSILPQTLVRKSPKTEPKHGWIVGFPIDSQVSVHSWAPQATWLFPSSPGRHST